MQTKKKDLKLKILEVSKNEFFNNGYKNTSLRKVAEYVGISHSNIMTYFKNKEDLFYQVVKPAIEVLKNSLTVKIDANKMSDEELLNFLDYDFSLKRNTSLMKLINSHKVTVAILLFKANKYDYKNIRENMLSLFVETIYIYIDELKRRDLVGKTKITDSFCKTVGSIYISSIERIVLDDMTEKELSDYVKEMTTLICYGTGMLFKGGI